MTDNRIVRSGSLASGLALAVALGAFALPGAAVASPLAASQAMAKAGTGAATVEVQYQRRAHRGQRQQRVRAQRAAPRYRDNVGSIAYDGYGYGYNRFSGQRYMSCMVDLGYGRVEPCDAGVHSW